MAQRTALQLTVYKIQSPQGSTVFDGGSNATTGTTQDVTIYFGGESAVVMRVPSRTGSASTYDCVIQLASGFKFWTIQEYADVVGSSGISAADLTNS
jgi:hypothetical protein